MSTTTLLNTGSGPNWTINAPDGVAVIPMKNGAPIANPSTDASVVATSLKITVNYDYSDFTNPKTGAIESIDFIGPTTTTPATPPTAGAQFPGLRLPFELDITNQLGVPINGYSVYLANQNLLNKPAPPVPDVGDVHPDNYAHFHGVTPTTFVDAASGTANATLTLYDPNFNSAAFGLAGAIPAPSFISVAGMIAAGATEKAAGLTLHSEDFPDATGGSFSLAMFAQDTIGEPVPPPSYAIAPANAVRAEGNAGTTPFTFTVTRTGDNSAAATLGYAITGSGANPAPASEFAGSALPSGTVAFAAGATAATITVPVAGNTLVQPDLGFVVTLSGPAGTSITTATASGTIQNDDVPVVPPSYAITAAAAIQPDGTSGTTPYAFTVTRTGDLSQVATVAYAVAGTGGNPAPGYLFANPSGGVSFAAGASTATLAVNVNAAAIRSSKDFIVTLAAPAGATLAQAAATGTIGVNTTGTPRPNDVVLTGTHDQYVIAATLDGKAYIQDLVAGRDGTQTVANPGEILFADGIGLFDATGNAETMTRLYQAAFGRAPDAPGLEYAVPLINQGSLSLRQIADGFLTSPEYQRQYGNPDTVTFVQEMYQNILHRAVNPGDPLDVAGVQNFSNLANSQGRGAALLALSDSQENHRLTIGIAGDKTDAQAARLYQAAFNRAPDAPGLQAVTNALKSGVSVEQIAQGFVDSGEFQRAYGTQSNGDFVAGLYRNVLHREADAGGKAQYMMALDAGYSRGFALASIADSGENRVNTAALTHDAWVLLK